MAMTWRASLSMIIHTYIDIYICIYIYIPDFYKFPVDCRHQTFCKPRAFFTFAEWKFATSNAKIEFVGKHNMRDNWETQMMDVRQKVF